MKLLSLLLLTLFSCTHPGDPTRKNKTTAEGQHVATGENLPSFKMVDKDGNLLNLNDLKGKKIFLNIWATWCPPCREEMPSIQKLYEKLKDKDVAFVMLALDDNFKTSVSYINSKGFTLPVYHPAMELPYLLDVNAIPATFIFDEKGHLIKNIKGGDDYDTAAYLQLMAL